MAQCVSHAPPHHTLPAFLNLNVSKGFRIVLLTAEADCSQWRFPWPQNLTKNLPITAQLLIKLIAFAAIIFLSVINGLSVKASNSIQIFTMAAKILVLTIFCLVGVYNLCIGKFGSLENSLQGSSTDVGAYGNDFEFIIIYKQRWLRDRDFLLWARSKNPEIPGIGIGIWKSRKNPERKIPFRDSRF